MWYTSRSHALQYFELFERIFFPPLFPIQQNELTTRPAVHAWDTIWTLSLHSALCCELHHFLLRYSILSLVVLHSQLELVLRTSCCGSSLVWSHPGWVWPCEIISAAQIVLIPYQTLAHAAVWYQDYTVVSFPDPFRKNREGVWQHVLHRGVLKEFNQLLNPVLMFTRASGNCMCDQPAVCNRAVAITSRKHVTKHFRVAKKVLHSMATEGKSVSNSRSLRNIRWIYPAR